MTDAELQKIGRILIRSTNWLGDAVMTTPAMGSVRKAFPRAEIVVVARPPVAELLAGHPACDKIIVWDKENSHRGPAALFRFSRHLQKQRFDLAILFQNAVEAAIMARLAGIPMRMGYRTDGRGWLLNRGVPIRAEEKRLHHVDYYLHMLKYAGIESDPGPLSLHCSEDEMRWAREQLAGRSPVAVNPGAAYGSAKRWLPERFASVADRIWRELGAEILLLGGPQEASVGSRISQEMHAPHLNFIGRTSVRQLMALLSQSRLLLTNDSGPMHIAAALNIPVVALFGSTDHTTTSPRGSLCRIVRHEVDCAPCLKRHCPIDHRCMTAIGVEEVMEAVRSLTGKSL